MPAPRLLYLASSFPYGWNDTFFGPEVRELVRRGVEVLAVPVRPRGPLTTPDAEPLTLRKPLLDLEIAAAALAEAARAPLATFRALILLLRSPRPSVLVRNLAAFPKALWVARLARARRFDHLHAHWAGPPSTVALVASRLAGVPWAFTAHADEIDAGNLLREKSASASFVRFVAHAGMERARRVAPGADERRWTVVRLGVELPPPPTGHEPAARPVLLMAARFSPEKRHDTLLDATRSLRREGLDVEVWLAGVGGGRAAVERAARHLGVEDAVSFLGWVDNAQILEWLRTGGVDAVVLPSDSEGLPVSLIEALAYGVPAVASDVGGVAELLGDGCGELVPAGDAQKLAAAVARVLRSPELRAERVRRGRKRAETEFGVEPVVGRLLELFGFADVRRGGGAGSRHGTQP